MLRCCIHFTKMQYMPFTATNATVLYSQQVFTLIRASYKRLTSTATGGPRNLERRHQVGAALTAPKFVLLQHLAADRTLLATVIACCRQHSLDLEMAPAVDRRRKPAIEWAFNDAVCNFCTMRSNPHTRQQHATTPTSDTQHSCHPLIDRHRCSGCTQPVLSGQANYSHHGCKKSSGIQALLKRQHL
jgi:hypothetical protein